VIPGARKKSHLACNHEAHISLRLWRRVSAIDFNLYFLVASTLCGKEAEDLWRKNIPPMLAAQSVFPSGPLPGFLSKIWSTNLEMNHLF
jgi:hypothetical protein